jgi:hypothetical protein
MVLQLYRQSTKYEVWIEPEKGDRFVGLCVGVGRTPAAAMAETKKNLRRVMKNLTRLKITVP